MSKSIGVAISASALGESSTMPPACKTAQLRPSEIIFCAFYLEKTYVGGPCLTVSGRLGIDPTYPFERAVTKSRGLVMQDCSALVATDAYRVTRDRFKPLLPTERQSLSPDRNQSEELHHMPTLRTMLMMRSKACNIPLSSRPQAPRLLPVPAAR